jgi:uncharacterized protein (TIGR03382 family)
MKPIVAVALLLVAAFCLYGFIASFEPGPRAIYFRIGYPAAALLCVGLAGALLLGSRRR